MSKFQEAAKQDERYHSLVNHAANGTIGQSSDNYERQFEKLQEELSLEDGLVFKGSRIVIPPSQIRSIVAKLHANHAGRERTSRRLERSSAGQECPTTSIKQLKRAGTVNNTDHHKSRNRCTGKTFQQDHSRLHRQISFTTRVKTTWYTLTNIPTDCIGRFLYYKGKDYLIYADQYSNYPMVTIFCEPADAATLIKTLRR